MQSSRINAPKTTAVLVMCFAIGAPTAALSNEVTEKLWADYLAQDQALVEEWEKRSSSEQSGVEELAFRASRDQLSRQLMLEALKTEGAKPGDAPFWWLKLKQRMDQIDQGNQAWLEEQLEEIEWFTLDEYGEAAEANAFLIAQHADNRIELQKRVLGIYEDLLPEGRVLPEHYAKLRDRVTTAEANVQRFGTQLMCASDTLELKVPLENPDKVDEWRSEFGLVPLEEYLASAVAEVGDCSVLSGN